MIAIVRGLLIAVTAAAVFALVMIVMSPLAILNAWALSTLWGWFAVPLGAKAIGVAHAYGLVAMLAALRPKYAHDIALKKGWDAVGTLALAPLVALGLGYVAHWFMVSP